MAIQLRQGAVDKATLPIEPMGPDASDSIVAMHRLEMGLMEKVVAVTLEEPYMGDPERTIALTWGRGEARPVSSGGVQDYTVASDRLPGQDPSYIPPRWEAGKWKHYHLRFQEGPLGKCSCDMPRDTMIGPVCYMPAPVAKVWFGDWDVVSYELQQRPGQVPEPEYTRTWHRERVAWEMWGGYGMDFPAGSAGVKRGELRRFDPPSVPHVSIVRIDSRNQRLPNTEVRPWEIFQWQDQCAKVARAYHAGRPNEQAAVMQVTEAQLQAFIENAVNAKLASMHMKGKGA